MQAMLEKVTGAGCGVLTAAPVAQSSITDAVVCTAIACTLCAGCRLRRGAKRTAIYHFRYVDESTCEVIEMK